jgi:hypothetical protein
LHDIGLQGKIDYLVRVPGRRVVGPASEAVALVVMKLLRGHATNWSTLPAPQDPGEIAGQGQIPLALWLGDSA